MGAASYKKIENVDELVRLIFLAEKLPDSVRITENPNLELVLKNAPRKISYALVNNGFELKNDALVIQYAEKAYPNANPPNFLHRGTETRHKVTNLSLWFIGTNPKIMVGSELYNTLPSAKNWNCDTILAHAGSSIYELSFFDRNELGESYGICRYPSEVDGERPDRKPWFDKGTELLKIAAEKYRLQEHHKVYRGKLNPDEVYVPAPVRPIRRILKNLFGA